MKRDIEKRLSVIEGKQTDWIGQVDYVDYIQIIDYETDSDWIEVYRENSITVFRHAKTNEIRGAFYDRRTEAEIVAQGGDLAFL